MPSRGILGTLIVSAALATVGLIAIDDAAGSAAPPAAPPTTGSPPTATVPPATPSGTAPTVGSSPYPPGVPTGLTATRVTSTSVILTWNPATRGCCEIVAYDITYARAFNDVFTSTSVGNVTTATITSGIQPGQQYTFQVAARDSLGKRSLSSTPVTVVTPIADTGPDQAPPSAPGGLTLSPAPPGITLTWTPATDDVGVTGYDVYRFDGWFTSTLEATVSGTTYSTTVPSAGPSPRLFYYVRARDAAGNVSIATPAVQAGQSTTTPPTTPPATPACRVTWTPTAQWRGGFTPNVTLTNISSQPLDGWTLAYTFGGDQRITASWNSTFTQDGAAVTMTNAAWNGDLAPGRGTTFGLRGTWTADASAPAAFTVDGKPCTAG